ncbi:LEA type 2 family protein [Pseudomonas sp. NPDC007930]|uniref:LEA type 2 family protein n=1 Tax=Pseudomonas sp. NPDC007930 TaxID=3364417 RepID=UPI0036E45AC9
MKTLWVLLASLCLASCALFRPADPVSVTLAGIDPLPGQDLEVRMALRLRVQNPNDTSIDYNGIALNLEVNGHLLASGVSDAQGSVGRYGEALISVPVSVSAFSVLRQAVGLADGAPARVPYVLRGKLGRGPLPAARFEERGSLDTANWGAAY